MPRLEFFPLLERPHLAAPSVLEAVTAWEQQTKTDDIKIAEIDPAYCGGEDLCNHYGVDRSTGANCLIVEAKKGDERSFHACLAPVGRKMNLGGTLRKYLGARIVSLAPLDFVLETTRMEHGSVTPIGLPKEWSIFIDSSLVDIDQMIIGGGLRKSKLKLPINLFLTLSKAHVMEGLCKPA